MKIKPFAVEEWMNQYEDGARFNIAETCVDSLSLDELFSLTGEDKDIFLADLCRRRLTYGDITGAPAFLDGICTLYKSIRPDHIITTHGAAGANHHIFYSLIEPGDHVITITPTYQQLYSIPESFGARVSILRLREENSFLPDVQQLRGLVQPGTKMICVNNPNNPTGALIPGAMLEEIVEIARSADSYLLCDETYRHLTQIDDWSPSIADLYEKGISVSSMSKVFSLAGLRQGWIASRDAHVRSVCLSHRDYNLISCSIFDEAISGLALKHRDKLLDRSRGIVRENLKILDQWIKNQPNLHYVKPQAGTTALICYDFDLSSYDFCKQMYFETGAFVTPGDCFDQPRSMRIGYACDKQTLQNGLSAVSRFSACLR